MKRFGLFIALLGLVSSTAWSEQDSKGSQDHPLFNRLPGYYIDSYSQQYGSIEVRLEGKHVDVYGTKTAISYYLKSGQKEIGSEAIVANYVQAVRNIGGSITYQEAAIASMRLPDKKVWVELEAASDSRSIELVILEEKALQQTIVADLEFLSKQLKQHGFVEVKGLYFDSNKATLKPESAPALGAMARLLRANPTLRVLVVGHTDMVGDIDYNLALSKRRARSVVSELVKRHSVGQGRLIAKGVGPLAPVSTNKTESDRSKNRRVEIVAIETQ